MKINVKSPFFINITDTNLTSARLDLYVYTGTQTTDRGAITYTINSTAYNNELTFEISELVKDYLEITFNGTYTSQMVWVDYQITRSISGTPTTADAFVQLEAYYGYGYFKDGANPQNDSILLQSNTTIYKLSTNDLIYPLNANTSIAIAYYLNGVEVATDSVVNDLTSAGRIDYLVYAGSVDTVYLDDGVDLITLNIENIDECKYTPYKLTFINKFGALQDLWMFKRSNLSLSTNEEKYKSNIVSGASYDTSLHQSKILTKQGNEKLTLNSGFYIEEYNEVFRQITLSDGVWIEIENQTLPVNITSSNLEFKTSLNDKLINYTIDVSFAFDKINNIR